LPTVRTNSLKEGRDVTKHTDVNTLTALINQLEAQSGKHIEEDIGEDIGMVRKDLNGLRFAYDPDKTTYFIDRGLRRPLTAKANDSLFGNNSWKADTVQLGSVTVGDLLTDNVYLAVTHQGPDKDTVFLIDDVPGGPQKRPITARGYQTCGFRPARTVQPDILAAMPAGDLIDFLTPPATPPPTPQPPKHGGCWITLPVANPDGTTTYEHFWEDPCPYGLNDLTFLDRVQDRLGSGRKARSAIVTIPKPTE
jgi:hypothetical protein